MLIKKGDGVKYTDAQGKPHPAEVAHVWGNSGLVNVVYQEGGVTYADTNVPVRTADTTMPGRFWEREGLQDGE